MKIPDHLRPFLLPAVLLGSTTLAFALGRLTSYVDSTPGGHPTANHASIREHQPFAFGSDGAGFSSDGLTVGATGVHTTVEQLTGGKPIGDWLKHLLAQEDDITRMTGMLLLLERVNTPAEFEAALGAVAQNGNGGRGRGLEFSMLLQKWVKLDPKAAMTYAQGIDANGQKMGGVNTVLQAWTRNHPQEAIAWAKANGANPDGKGNNPALGTVITQLARTDVLQALQIAQTENAGNMKGIPNTLVNQLVAQRGEESAREAMLGVSDDSLRDSMLRQYAGRIANRDPQKAIAWVAELPAGETKSAALADAVAQWAQDDAPAAAAYMATLPIGTESDAPRARFVRSVARIDPAGAVEWANSITDPDIRINSLSDAIGNWMRSDAEAAKQWVTDSPLPSDTKTQILAAATRGGGGQRRGGGNGNGGNGN